MNTILLYSNIHILHKTKLKLSAYKNASFTHTHHHIFESYAVFSKSLPQVAYPDNSADRQIEGNSTMKLFTISCRNKSLL